MKILYAIQGTGNGHLSRAKDIIPVLQQQGELDILVSGSQADISLSYPVKYTFKGLSFIFGRNGGVDLLKTYKKSNLRRLLKEINSLPVEQYDLIVNDFEPVSAWACYMKNKECISLSHQAAVLHKKSPQPKKTDPIGKAVLKHYAPTTEQYGFHFKAYDKNIFTPVIRKQIRDLKPDNKGHYTVYLPAYSDQRIIKVLSECRDTRWQVFSKHNTKPFIEKNISVSPINNDNFICSMAASAGILCGAGFETPAEAMYLQKKLLVIPMKGQFEQHCNAAALAEMGIPVIKSLKRKHLNKIKSWIQSGLIISVNYPDDTEQIVSTLVSAYASGNQRIDISPRKKAFTVKRFRELSLKKILVQLAG